MKRLIIHFGTPRTGCASIEASLSGRDLGADFHYVDLGIDNAPGALLNAFMKPERRHADLQRRGGRMPYEALLADRAQTTEALRKQLAMPRDNLILSSRGLNLLDEGELRALKEFVSEHVDDIRLMAYVRAPKAFMESQFQQLAKGKLGRLDVQALYPRYRERFEKFENAFGRWRVSYFNFAPDQLMNGCVVQDFCSRTGILRRRVEVRRTNESLSRDAVGMLFAYRKHANSFPERPTVLKENRLLAEALAQLRSERLAFHSALVRPVLESRHDDIAWMQERLPASLAEDLESADAKNPVRSEDDLMAPSPESVAQLAGMLEVPAERLGALPADSRRIASWVHALRLKLAGEPAWENALGGERAAGDKELSVDDLSVAGVDPAAVRRVLARLGARVADLEHGQGLRVPGLGRFLARELPAGPDGEAGKRIIFRPQRPKGPR